MLAPEWNYIEWNARMTALLESLADRIGPGNDGIRPDTKKSCETRIFVGEREECADLLLADLSTHTPAISRDERAELLILTDAVGSHTDEYLKYLANRHEILDNLPTTK